LEEYSCTEELFEGGEFVYRFDSPPGVRTLVDLTTDFAPLSASLLDELDLAPRVPNGVFVLEDGTPATPLPTGLLPLWELWGPGVDGAMCMDWSMFGDPSFIAEPDTSYWIVLDHISGAEGPFDITLDCEEVTEVCDNLFDDDGDGLIDCQDNDCASNLFCRGVGQCNEVAQIVCGETVSGNTATDSNAGALLDGYACNPGNYSGPEMVWSWVAPNSLDLTLAEFSLVGPEPTETNHDLFVMEATGNPCNSSMCPGWGHGASWGSNSLSFPAVNGQVYYFIVDGFAGDAGPFQARLDCTLSEE
jgi:hypothetical protein